MRFFLVILVFLIIICLLIAWYFQDWGPKSFETSKSLKQALRYDGVELIPDEILSDNPDFSIIEAWIENERHVKDFILFSRKIPTHDWTVISIKLNVNINVVQFSDTNLHSYRNIDDGQGNNILIFGVKNKLDIYNIRLLTDNNKKIIFRLRTKK